MNWTGVYPAATTAFREDESLDLAATAAHLDALIRAGVHGLVVLGSVGETHALRYEEKLDVLRAAVEVVDRRVPLIAGVAQTTTAEARRFAKDAELSGVDGLMVLPATLYPADERETVAHFRSVARGCGLPILCYNNPVAYGVDLTPRVFAELAGEQNLVAIKESSNDPRRITDLVNEVGVEVDRVYLNGLYPERFSAEDEEELDAKIDDAENGPRAAIRAALSQRRRSVAQREQLHRLVEMVEAPVTTLPFIFEPDLDLPQLRELAAEAH